MTLKASFQAYVTLTELPFGSLLSDETFDEARKLRKSCLKAVQEVLEKNPAANDHSREATIRSLKKKFTHVEEFLTSGLCDARQQLQFKISKARLVASMAAIEQPPKEDAQQHRAFEDGLARANSVEECQRVLLEHATLADGDVIKGLQKAALKQPSLLLDLACDDMQLMRELIRHLVTNKRAEEGHAFVVAMPDGIESNSPVNRHDALSILAIEAYCHDDDAIAEKCVNALSLRAATCQKILWRLLDSGSTRLMELLKLFVEKMWLSEYDLLRFLQSPRPVDPEASLKIALELKKKEYRLEALKFVAFKLLRREKAFYPVRDLLVHIDSREQHAFVKAVMESVTQLEETLCLSIAHQAESATNFSGIVDQMRKSLEERRVLSERMRAEREQEPIVSETSESFSSSDEGE